MTDTTGRRWGVTVARGCSGTHLVALALHRHSGGCTSWHPGVPGPATPSLGPPRLGVSLIPAAETTRNDGKDDHDLSFPAHCNLGRPVQNSSMSA